MDRALIGTQRERVDLFVSRRHCAFNVWVLLGDSEMAEGSIWEAFDKAGHYKLDNVIAILDMNRLGQRGATELGWNAPVYAERARAFGWHAIEIDGHDIDAIDRAYAEAVAQTEQPTCIIAKTLKGSGVPLVENKNGWHGKPLSPAQAKQAIEELGGERHITVSVARAETLQPAPQPPATPLKLPVYEVGASSETFPVGGSKVLRRSDADQATIVAAGVTLHESLRAYEQLKSEGVQVRVIDAYSVKPIDVEALHEAARVPGGCIVVVEDHWSEGGLGDAVLGAFADGAGNSAQGDQTVRARNADVGETRGTPERCWNRCRAYRSGRQGGSLRRDAEL